jgi:hypothetical protein
MKYEDLTEELDRVFPIGGGVVGTIKEYTFEDAVNEIAKAFKSLESEKEWLYFIEESVFSEEDECLGWTLKDARIMVGYARKSVEMAIGKAFEAGRLF